MTINMGITRNGDYVEFCDDCEQRVVKIETHAAMHSRLGKAVAA